MLMKRMRDNTKWIMLVTALAFVALMVFEWGMDITGRSGGSMELGRVNGTPVPVDLYNANYRILYDQLSSSRSEPVSSFENKELEEAAWEESVNQILIQQELQRRGVRVTDEEIRQAALFAPPPELRNAPAFQTDGVFDLSKYQQFISMGADPMLLQQLEAYYRDLIPRGKLMRQVGAGAWLPDAKLWRAFQEENERAVVSFIALDPLSRIGDAEVPVSPDDVRAYYQENRDEFLVPARASIRFTYMSRIPTAADSAEIREEAARLRDELNAGEADFVESARLLSADPGSAAVGGNLGIVRPGEMVAPFDSAVFQGPVGTVQGPVVTTFGLHLIRVDDRWGADSASAHHILLPYGLPDASEMRLLSRADTLERNLANRSLEDVAESMGLPVEEFEVTHEFPFAAGAGQITEGADWALEEAAPGEVSPVFETAQAFYAVELIRKEPESVQSLEDATPIIRQVLLRTRKLELAEERGAALVDRLRNGSETLESIAAEEGLSVQRSEPFTRLDFVPGMGRRNAAVGTAFGLPVGAISSVVRTDMNAFIIRVDERTEADREMFDTVKDLLRNQAMMLVQQQRIAEWMEALRENARVVDRRQQVFQAAEDAAQRPQAPMFF